MGVARVVALVLVSTVLTAPVGPAAAGQTCHGLPVTLVGTPGERLDGTDGADVIVTNGADQVFSGAGDDTLCVDGRGYTEIWTGVGDDLVDTTVRSRWTVVALGAGADTYVGGRGPDTVLAGDRGRPREDDFADTISTGGGTDEVDSGQPGLVNHDDVDLGPGTDWLTLAGDGTDGDLSGGDTDAEIDWLIVVLRKPGSWVVDDGRDVMVWNGTQQAAWEDLSVWRVDGSGHTIVEYRGTPGDDNADVLAPMAGASLGSGDDRLHLEPRDELTGAFVGGQGRDRISVADHREGQVLIDMRSHRLGTSIEAPGATMTGFEDARSWSGDARIVGDGRSQHFLVAACHARVLGLGGADELQARQYIRCGTGRSVVLRGGRGDDDLIGSAHREHLLGGPGRDRAVGRGEIDRCRAEVMVSCERS